MCKYLKYKQLHKYVYFFSNLSYAEFLTLRFGKEVIVKLEEKTKIGPITVGDRRAILKMTSELANRVTVLRKYVKVNKRYTNEKKIILRILILLSSIG